MQPFSAVDVTSGQSQDRRFMDEPGTAHDFCPLYSGRVRLPSAKPRRTRTRQNGGQLEKKREGTRKRSESKQLSDLQLCFCVTSAGHRDGRGRHQTPKRRSRSSSAQSPSTGAVFNNTAHSNSGSITPGAREVRKKRKMTNHYGAAL